MPSGAQPGMTLMDIKQCSCSSRSSVVTDWIYKILSGKKESCVSKMT